MSAEKTRPPGERRERKRASAEGKGGREEESKKRLCCWRCRYFKTKNGFNFSRAPKQTWIEGGEGGESRAQVEKQYRRLPTNHWTEGQKECFVLPAAINREAANRETN